jgi:epoxyqueuosine reductase
MLAELATLDEPAFRAMFSGSPIKRIGRDRFMRNVLIAIGNSGLDALATVAARRLADPSPLVRGAAVWAMWRLVSAERLLELGSTHCLLESDLDVLSEWRSAGVID